MKPNVSMNPKLVLASILVAAMLVIAAFVVITNSDEKRESDVVVTMGWQKEMVDTITQGSLHTVVLLPPNTSPHDMSILPSSLQYLTNAQLFIEIGSGVEFEDEILKRVKDDLKTPRLSLMDLLGHDHGQTCDCHNCGCGAHCHCNDCTAGGGCHCTNCGSTHNHASCECANCACGAHCHCNDCTSGGPCHCSGCSGGHGHGHEHGDDCPCRHIWVNPGNLMIMAERLAEELKKIFPEVGDDVIDQGLAEYLQKVEGIKDVIESIVEKRDSGQTILVWHNAWGLLMEYVNDVANEMLNPAVIFTENNPFIKVMAAEPQGGGGIPPSVLDIIRNPGSDLNRTAYMSPFDSPQYRTEVTNNGFTIVNINPTATDFLNELHKFVTSLLNTLDGDGSLHGSDECDCHGCQCGAACQCCSCGHCHCTNCDGHGHGHTCDCNNCGCGAHCHCNDCSGHCHCTGCGDHGHTCDCNNCGCGAHCHCNDCSGHCHCIGAQASADAATTTGTPTGTDKLNYLENSLYA